jgi:hypothetical protein
MLDWLENGIPMLIIKKKKSMVWWRESENGERECITQKVQQQEESG